ncbi:hypothetical protein BJY52DRAFT_1308339 [Lactarius psammicola]|nr:hypothetical protein BJY52DRAFT_1308339 [Lactarius psammicola]
MAQVCDQFSPFLSRGKNLRLTTTQSSSGQDDVGGEQWLEFVRSFGGARDFSVVGKLTTDVLFALGLADEGHTTVLPALRHLRVEEPMAMDHPSWNALHSFITSRSLSGRPVECSLRLYQCNIYPLNFRNQQGLNRHLGEENAYRFKCSCFARTDVLISDPSSPIIIPFQFDLLVDRHSSLREPDIVAPSTVTAPHSQ